MLPLRQARDIGLCGTALRIEQNSSKLFTNGARPGGVLTALPAAAGRLWQSWRQLALPQLALTGDLPDIKPGETRVMTLKADVTNDRTNRDCYLVYRTTDVAL